MLVLHRYRRLLRTALLVLLALGMVISPTLAAVSELHGVEHAVGSASDSDHDHPHSGSDRLGHHGGGADPDPDHATGVHGLLHQGCSVSVMLPEAALNIPVPAVSEPLLPELARLQLPGDSPTHPFRPPIA